MMTDIVGPSSESRPLKRRRICLEVPAEIWALALDFLPYDSVLQTAAVSRSMLREVQPRISMLHIDRPSQLHAAVARRRYRDVVDVYIYSLLHFATDADGDIECSVDEDTATRAVPFLCGGNFSRLERVFLGGRRPGDGCASGFVPSEASDHEDKERMNTLINSISGAYRAGSLARNVWVAGLCCPQSYRFTNLHQESSCLVCHNACRSFPVESVIDFECEGSSQKHDLHRRQWPFNTITDQIYGLDVCLKRGKIETIVKERSRGRELLYSEARLYQLLGRGTRHIVVPDEGKELFVVKYEEHQLGEIKLLLQNASFEVKNLRHGAVTKAIKRSFAEDERDPQPSRGQCYLAEKSFADLLEMGLPVDEADFLNEDEWDGRKCKAVHLYNWRFG